MTPLKYALVFPLILTSISALSAEKTYHYKYTENEKKLMSLMMKEDADSYSAGNESQLFELDRITSKQVSSLYEQNQVAGDKKYLNKIIAITGEIQEINSGLGNEPYIVLEGAGDFSGVHIKFTTPDIDKIAELRKGETGKFVCTGNGVLLGSPVFHECDFLDKYLTEEQEKIKKNIGDVLDAKYVSEKMPSPEGKLVFLSLLTARGLPDNSACYSNLSSQKCQKDIAKTSNKKSYEKMYAKMKADIGATAE